MNGGFEVVHCLCELGADVNDIDSDGNTPCHYVAMQKVHSVEDCARMLKVLVEVMPIDHAYIHLWLVNVLELYFSAESRETRI